VLVAGATGPGNLRALFAWLEESGHAVDIPALRRREPGVGWHDFADWARSQRRRLRGLCPRALVTP
jgi:hypothetical protein